MIIDRNWPSVTVVVQIWGTFIFSTNIYLYSVLSRNYSLNTRDSSCNMSGILYARRSVTWLNFTDRKN